MEDRKKQYNYFQELTKANPIQKRVPIPPQSIAPLLPLPQFRHSEELVDVGQVFSTREQKQQHVLKQPQLNKMFSKPLYQSSERFNLQATNLKFACLKAVYSQSAMHPPALPLSVDASNGNELVFESRFESGNLAFAARGQSQSQYNLLLQKDINSSRCIQWFFFRVHNGIHTGRVRFNIINFFKNYSLYENGMKILFCCESSKYVWMRGCQDITYVKNNIKIGADKTYYTLSFSFNFQRQNDIIYFAHSAPYTYSMLDSFLLKISSNEQSEIVKRKTLTKSPGGNHVDMLTISNFRSKRQKKVVFITSRIHPGQTPSSYVCEGLITFLLSNSEQARQLRDRFVFKIVPMLNPDGVINGSYRCSLSGYDLNRVWHFDNKISSPQIYYTKKAILEQGQCFLFIDLHAHSKKKGVFMYGCQNKVSPYLSRHIPYLLWKEVPYFNYYQCNFGMKIGRQGTSRLTVHRLMNLPFSYTMQHSFCGPIKEKYHFTIQHYREIGRSFCLMLKKYYCSRQQPEPEIFNQLYTSKQLMQVGCRQDDESSQDSDLDEPIQFKEMREAGLLKKKQSSTFKSKLIELSSDSIIKLSQQSPNRELSPRKLQCYNEHQQKFQSFLNKNVRERNRKLTRLVPQIVQINKQINEEILGEEVVLAGRMSETQKRISADRGYQMPSRPYSRYQFQEMDSLNNLFLPSLTSASYKRYGKKISYPKTFIQIGKRFLESRGLLKEEIRSTSRKKGGQRNNILSYL